MDECIFCRIAGRQAEAVILHEDAEVMAFLDIAPRKMKTVYHVNRFTFAFTGGDIPHVHADVVPMT